MRPLPVANRLATALAIVGAWWRRCRGQPADVAPGALERPWLRTWDHLPKRSAGWADTSGGHGDASPAKNARMSATRTSGASCAE